MSLFNTILYVHNSFSFLNNRLAFSLQRKCDLKHPPGDEIYRSGTLSMFEVIHREVDFPLEDVLLIHFILPYPDVAGRWQKEQSLCTESLLSGEVIS